MQLGEYENLMEKRWEELVGVIKVCEKVLGECSGVNGSEVVNSEVENLLQKWWALRKRLRVVAGRMVHLLQVKGTGAG